MGRLKERCRVADDFYILPILFYLNYLLERKKKEKSSRYYIILFPENIQANDPYSKRPSSLMHPLPHSLIPFLLALCLTVALKTVKKEGGRGGSGGRLAARPRKFIPEGMNGGKTGCDEQAFSRGCARSFFPSRSRVVNSTGFGDH